MRVLDVGCGWGTFALHAARHYGVHVVGVTLSHEQADYASKRMVDQGVGGLVEIRVQDYRDVTDGPYDAISSIGMAEHVGAAMLATYAADLFALLRPRGRLLNHAVSRRPRKPAAKFSKTSFIDRYVFPDGEIEPMPTMIEALAGADFEVRDVEALREHYALTLRAWVGTWRRTGTRRWPIAAPGGHECGGCTWPARRWLLRRIGSGSTRFWQSNAPNGGRAECPVLMPNFCSQPASRTDTVSAGSRTVEPVGKYIFDR
jgi:protein-L-isoaspartate O-methyltransferase